MSGGLGLLGTLKRKIIESKAEVEKWKKTVEEASWKIKVGKKELDIRLGVFFPHCRRCLKQNQGMK